MQALPYQGPKNVRVKGVPDPVLVANDHSCCVRSGRACRLTQVPLEERSAPHVNQKHAPPSRAG